MKENLKHSIHLSALIKQRMIESDPNRKGKIVNIKIRDGFSAFGKFNPSLPDNNLYDFSFSIGYRVIVSYKELTSQESKSIWKYPVSHIDYGSMSHKTWESPITVEKSQNKLLFSIFHIKEQKRFLDSLFFVPFISIVPLLIMDESETKLKPYFCYEPFSQKSYWIKRHFNFGTKLFDPDFWVEDDETIDMD